MDVNWQIKENLEWVREDGCRCSIVGRRHEEIRLVVVTKTQPVEVLRAVVDAGALILGENYAEELVRKIAVLQGKLGVEWHMIGHVQSRKAKLVVEHFDMIYSLDSVRLARKVQPVLMRVATDTEGSP